MNAEQLYEKMKDALAFFGLRFHDKHLVEVVFHEGSVVFRYDGATITFEVGL